MDYALAIFTVITHDLLKCLLEKFNHAILCLSKSACGKHPNPDYRFLCAMAGVYNGLIIVAQTISVHCCNAASISDTHLHLKYARKLSIHTLHAWL